MALTHPLIIEKLLTIYRFIEKYMADHNKETPSMQEVVDAGLASVRSMVKFYYDHMESLQMIERTPGRAYSVRLLPLESADAVIVAALEKEKVKA